MKQKIILLIACITNVILVQLQITSVTPAQTTEQCPNFNITFLVTLTGTPTNIVAKALNELFLTGRSPP